MSWLKGDHRLQDIRSMCLGPTFKRIFLVSSEMSLNNQLFDLKKKLLKRCKLDSKNGRPILLNFFLFCYCNRREMCNTSFSYKGTLEQFVKSIHKFNNKVNQNYS